MEFVVVQCLCVLFSYKVKTNLTRWILYIYFHIVLFRTKYYSFYVKDQFYRFILYLVVYCLHRKKNFIEYSYLNGIWSHTHTHTIAMNVPWIFNRYVILRCRMGLIQWISTLKITIEMSVCRINCMPPKKIFFLGAAIIQWNGACITQLLYTSNIVWRIFYFTKSLDTT